MVASSGAIRPTAGDPGTWAAAWASDTVLAAQKAFTGVTFSGTAAGRWEVHFNDRPRYMQAADDLKEGQIEKAGAPLAALLNTIWP